MAVGAAVTFGTTWWQLNRARDSEEKAYARERAARRDEVEAVSLHELQEVIGSWYSETLQTVGCAFEPDDPTSIAAAEAFIRESPVARSVTLIWLITRCRDDGLQVAVGEFMSSTLGACHDLLAGGDIHTRNEFHSAVLPTSSAHQELQNRIGARLRILE